MKVTGETFSFHHKRKGAEEARYQKYQNFQAKRTAVGQNSGELYTKKHRMIFLLCYYFNKYFEKI